MYLLCHTLLHNSKDFMVADANTSEKKLDMIHEKWMNPSDKSLSNWSNSCFCVCIVFLLSLTSKKNKKKNIKYHCCCCLGSTSGHVAGVLHMVCQMDTTKRCPADTQLHSLTSQI